MATKKLSEALAELQAAASVSGLDVRLVVAGQSSTDNAQTITLQQLLTVLNVPTAQSGTQGTSKNYIYSASSDEMHTALSGKVWIYNYGNNQYLRFKHWGASNDTEGINMSQVMLPTVSYSARGLMDNTLYRRIDNHTLTTANSADAVVINYTNFQTGGNKTLTIERASSAKAGVMTAEDKTKLDNLTAYARDLGNFESEEAALDALKDIEISSNSNIVHVHCTYANGAMSITMMQSIENDYCRQIIFNKSKLYQRAIYFTNGERTEISYAEDWSCLFGDRLQWDSGENKYVLRQFDLSFNQKYTDPIPTATANNDGLMSKEDKQLLENIKAQLNL
uniref:hypothetical protein n=1 Tax=Alloprevotella sp. TaxID=1872471 RepID=UPI003FEF26B5